jgi:hypothetical protein
VGIIEPKHKSSRAGLLPQGHSGTSQELRLIWEASVEVGQQLGERAEGDGRCCVGGDRPAGDMSLRPCRDKDLTSQSSLAHAGLTGDDDPGHLGTADCIQDGRELLVAAN